MRSGEAPAREPEVAIVASLVLLDFCGDVGAKRAWLEHVRTHAKPFCRANEEPGRRVASALRAYDAELCELVSKAMPSETPIAGGQVMAYMKDYCRTPVRFAASPDGQRRSTYNLVRRGQCCIDRIAAYITQFGSGMEANMGAQAFTVAPQLRADPHHNSPGRKARAATAEAAAERRLRVRAEAALARAATAEAAAERRRRARVEAVLAHESAAKDAAVAAAVRSAETLHAERVKIVKAQNAKLNAEVVAAHGCLGELADRASAEDGSVAACINKLYERPGGVISAHVRQLIMEHLVLGVPPSAVPGALEAYEAAILAAAGEGADSCAGASRPSLASVMLIRFELAYVVLICAAYDIASADDGRGRRPAH